MYKASKNTVSNYYLDNVNYSLAQMHDKSSKVINITIHKNSENRYISNMYTT